MHTIDWAAVIAAAKAGQVDPAVEDELRDALRAAATRRHEAAIWEHVKQAVAEEGYADAVAVVFDTTEWDNGFFLDPGDATVYFADGRTKSADLDEFGPGTLNCAFVDAYGTLSRNDGLLVDLRTPGLVDLDENVDYLMEQVAAGLPTPPPPDHEGALLGIVQARAAEMVADGSISAPPLVAVFPATEYTSGRYYAPEGWLYTDKNKRATGRIELPRTADAHLTALSERDRPLDWDSAVFVDLSAGTVTCARARLVSDDLTPAAVGR